MSTLVEQLFQRWKDAADILDDQRLKLEAAERSVSDARRAENDAATLLRKALGDKRVLIGDRVVWTARGEYDDVWVHYAAVVTPEQVEPAKVGMD